MQVTCVPMHLTNWPITSHSQVTFWWSWVIESGCGLTSFLTPGSGELMHGGAYNVVFYA